MHLDVKGHRDPTKLLFPSVHSFRFKALPCLPPHIPFTRPTKAQSPISYSGRTWVVALPMESGCATSAHPRARRKLARPISGASHDG